MARLARIRKAIVTALGMAVTLALLVPSESVPEGWRPIIGLILALGTVAGVYKVRNDQPSRSRVDLAEHTERVRPRRGGYESGSRPASEMPPPRTGIKQPPFDPP